LSYLLAVAVVCALYPAAPGAKASYLVKNLAHSIAAYNYSIAGYNNGEKKKSG